MRKESKEGIELRLRHRRLKDKPKNPTTKRCYLCNQVTTSSYGIYISTEFVCGDCVISSNTPELKKRVGEKRQHEEEIFEYDKDKRNEDET